MRPGRLLGSNVLSVISGALTSKVVQGSWSDVGSVTILRGPAMSCAGNRARGSRCRVLETEWPRSAAVDLGLVPEISTTRT